MTRLPSESTTCVPTGTGSSIFSPSAPCFPEPPPRPPRPPSNAACRGRREGSRGSGSATRTTSPPRPPSPPSGPPFGTYFSLRKLSAPSPPPPARTRMRARSFNTAGLVGDGYGPPLPAPPEAQRAVALGEDRVVLADPRAGAGAEARAALPDDDHAGLHRLAVEQLDAEALCVRIAAVAGGAKTFLVSHLAVLHSFCLERGDRAL